MNIAIIPARGGSKRIPRKNIANFAGRPMIEYPIKAALSSKVFDAVVVSTDDVEIADFSANLGALVPGLREKSLSGDFTTTIEVIRDYLTKNEFLIETDKICCIYPTTPFLDEFFLRDSYDIFMKSSASFLVSSIELPTNYGRSFKIDGNGKIEFNFKGTESVRTQDLPKNFVDAGQFYWASKYNWLTESSIFGENTFSYELPPDIFLDIDTQLDWQSAEKLYLSKIEDGGTYE